MEIKKKVVVSNRDPFHQGRIKIDNDKWISPLAGVSGMFNVPRENSEVMVIDDAFYTTEKIRPRSKNGEDG